MNNSDQVPERTSKASKDKGPTGVGQGKRNPRPQQPQNNNNSDTEMEPASDGASEQRNQDEANAAEEMKDE